MLEISWSPYLNHLQRIQTSCVNLSRSIQIRTAQPPPPRLVRHLVDYNQQRTRLHWHLWSKHRTVPEFSVLDNHLDVLIRLNTDLALPTSPSAGPTTQPFRAADCSFPPATNPAGRFPPPRARSSGVWKMLNRSQEAHTRLASLTWFMKCSNKALSRPGNRHDEARATLIDGKFKSIAILDDGSLFTSPWMTLAVDDANPIKRGVGSET